LSKGDTHRGVGLERAPEAELLAHLTDRGEHFLPEQAYACSGILVADEAVARPEAQNGRARLLEQPAELLRDTFAALIVARSDW
jgi:hypothetical protein